MPHATTPDGVKLYYEEAGTGTPILFVHEYCGDWRSLGAADAVLLAPPSLHHLFVPRLSRLRRARHRVDMYGQQHAVDDAKHMLDHLKIDKAHIVGLSQGAFATAHFGRCYTDRALSARRLAGVGFRRGPRGP